MIVGVPTEVKSDEYRVALRPVGAELLSQQGHTVLIQSQAGRGSGFTDEEYNAAGAEIVPAADEIWARAETIVKVKEPQPAEIKSMRPGQAVFTYYVAYLRSNGDGPVYATGESPLPSDF